MPRVEFEHVRKAFAGQPALRDLSLTVADGEYLALVGPSGSGKTTLLRLIAGLTEPDSGRLLFDDRDAADLPPEARDTGMVFAGLALYPHLTAAENLAFGLRLRKFPRAEIETRVRDLAGRLGLAALLGRRPEELSSGERQRVALGRALVQQPRVLLLDEPLAHLDAPWRDGLRHELRRHHRETRATVVHVTHDQAEALALGTRVAVLLAGELAQVDDPQALHDRPATCDVAGFIGTPRMNFLPGSTAPGWVPAGRDPASVTVGLRPHDLELVPAGATDPAAVVEDWEPGGAEGLQWVRLGDLRIAVRLPSAHRRPAGSAVGLRAVQRHVFDGATGQRLPDT